MNQETYNKQVSERADRVVQDWSKRDGGRALGPERAPGDGHG